MVPWLLALDRTHTVRGAAASGLLMCAAFVAAIFAWFGFAIAVYSAGAAAIGLVVLLLCAPLLQPQFVVFAIVRRLAFERHGRALAALAGASAWVATEWAFPKLLADSLAHGFYPSPVLRQFADVAGTPGITFLIVLMNEGLAAACATRLAGRSWKAAALPATASAAILAAMALYGQMRLAEFRVAPPGTRPVKIALVQSNIAAYDRLRREMGAYDAVRYVLDTHYAMSRDSIDRDHVDALMWSETVFPTTFGKPKSEAGGELDREIEDFVARAGLPLVFGTYDRDDDGEYNSAVFLEPGSVGATPRFDVYRKSRLFFLTEYIPWWMDFSAVRELLPWAGHWKPGPGARVLPLHLRDGRDVPVLPMICLDDVDATLGIAGARLGAQMILTMSNDSWFAEHAGGAHLHLVVAAFRSIETRLPQLRVTSTGISAVIDPTGEIIAGAGVGERRVLVGETVPREAAKTLFVRWGDWLGPVALLVTIALLLRPRRDRGPQQTGDGGSMGRKAPRTKALPRKG